MNNLHMRPEVLKRIREQYPVGCTVEIIEMRDPYRDMPAGLRGTVTHIDDTGTVFADWENGSTLGAVLGEDRIRRECGLMIALLLSFGGDPMTDWFEWNGRKCTEFGIHVSEHPPITLPAERSTFTNVPGRSGSLTVLEDEDVYDDMLLTCTCLIENTDRLPEIAAWLRGSGTVTFANRQGGFYHARVVNQIPFEKVLRGHPHRSFAVTFRCQPFFHLKADDITVTAPGTFIANLGCIASEPVVRVMLAGDAEIAIGGYLFSLTGVTGTVTIDTPRLECYQDYTSRNACIAGDYSKIPAVGAYVGWTGNVEKIVIAPNWRTL